MAGVIFGRGTEGVLGPTSGGDMAGGSEAVFAELGGAIGGTSLMEDSAAGRATGGRPLVGDSRSTC